jgi:hypothetical protein
MGKFARGRSFLTSGTHAGSMIIVDGSHDEKRLGLQECEA